MAIKRTNWKREAGWWRNFAHLQMLALSAIAKDPGYECQCGTGRYDDGEMCPKCFAFYTLDEMKAARAGKRP